MVDLGSKLPVPPLPDVLIYIISFIYETEIIKNTSQTCCENQEGNRYESTFKSINYNLHIKNHNYYNMKII